MDWSVSWVRRNRSLLEHVSMMGELLLIVKEVEMYAVGCPASYKYTFKSV